MSKFGGASNNRLQPRKLFKLGLRLALIAILGLLVVNGWVRWATANYRFADVASIPSQQVAIVFGAGIRYNQPSAALRERLDGAIQLYQAGRVQHLLMSGDNSQTNYDEVTVMRDYAIAHGVPASAITRDYAGFSTYETCYRAKAIFGVTQAILVTQDYHQPRAIYTCRELGVAAIGLSIPDWHFKPEQSTTYYPPATQVRYTTREWLARCKALFEVHISQPQPTFLGPAVGLGEIASTQK